MSATIRMTNPKIWKNINCSSHHQPEIHSALADFLQFLRFSTPVVSHHIKPLPFSCSSISEMLESPDSLFTSKMEDSGGSSFAFLGIFFGAGLSSQRLRSKCKGELILKFQAFSKIQKPSPTRLLNPISPKSLTIYFPL